MEERGRPPRFRIQHRSSRRARERRSALGEPHRPRRCAGHALMLWGGGPRSRTSNKQFASKWPGCRGRLRGPAVKEAGAGRVYCHNATSCHKFASGAYASQGSFVGGRRATCRLIWNSSNFKCGACCARQQTRPEPNIKQSIFPQPALLPPLHCRQSSGCSVSAPI